VCLIDYATCEFVCPVVATYFGRGQRRITIHASLPSQELEVVGPLLLLLPSSKKDR
jgi:hypothetical protein